MIYRDTNSRLDSSPEVLGKSYVLASYEGEGKLQSSELE